MKIEKLEMLAVGVSNLDEAVKFYEKLLDTKFKTHETKLKEGTARWAVTPFGFELLESPVEVPGPDRVRSFHLRVTDVEKTKAEMKTKGFEPVEELQIGKFREVIYHLRGLRMVFVDGKLA